MVNGDIVHFENPGDLLPVREAVYHDSPAHIPEVGVQLLNVHKLCILISSAYQIHSHTHEGLTLTIDVAAASIPYIAAMECMLLVYTRLRSTMSA